MTNVSTFTEKSKKQRDNIKNANKSFYYTPIVDRLRTVSWSNSSHPTGVVKPVLKKYLTTWYSGVNRFVFTAQNILESKDAQNSYNHGFMSESAKCSTKPIKSHLQAHWWRIVRNLPRIWSFSGQMDPALIEIKVTTDSSLLFLI